MHHDHTPQRQAKKATTGKMKFQIVNNFKTRGPLTLIPYKPDITVGKTPTDKADLIKADTNIHTWEKYNKTVAT